MPRRRRQSKVRTRVTNGAPLGPIVVSQVKFENPSNIEDEKVFVDIAKEYSLQVLSEDDLKLERYIAMISLLERGSNSTVQGMILSNYHDSSQEKVGSSIVGT